MSIYNARVDCPYCGRAMRRVEPVKYLCPKRCLTRPITRQEAASWLKKKAGIIGLNVPGCCVLKLEESV